MTEDVAFFDGPARPISREERNADAMISRVSPRLNAARFSACSSGARQYLTVSIIFSWRVVIAGIVFPASAE